MEFIFPLTRSITKSFYVSNEFFYDFRNDKFNENRGIPFGLKFKLHDRASMKLFYMLQSKRSGDKWNTKPCHRILILSCPYSSLPDFSNKFHFRIIIRIWKKRVKKVPKRYFIKTPGIPYGDDRIFDSMGCAFPWTFARRS